jgi:hypothetical protein
VIRALDGFGGATVSERIVAKEDVHFKLPPEVGPATERPDYAPRRHA